MKPIRTFFQQNVIKLWLGIEKPVYEITKGRHAKNRFLSSVDFHHVGTNVKIINKIAVTKGVDKEVEVLLCNVSALAS